MKKIILVLALLVLAMPALGEVKIYVVQTAAPDPCWPSKGAAPGYYEATIFFDATSEATKQVRAIALDITLGVGPGKTVCDSNIISVNAIDPNTDYYVFPGSISIDANNGTVSNWGTCVAEGGPTGKTMTIEMGSLYATTDTKHPLPPQKKGSVCGFIVDKTCDITLAVNAERGGVIMEDGTPADVNFVDQHSPGKKITCRGDANKDGKVTKVDLGAVVAYLTANASAPSWTVNKTVAGVLNPKWDACMDMNVDDKVTKVDGGGLVNILNADAKAPAWSVNCK